MPCTAHPHASLTPFQLCLHMSLSSCRTRVQPMHMIRTCLHTSPCIYLWTPYHNVHATNTWALHYTHTCLPRSPPPGAPTCPCCACHTRFQDTHNRCTPEHIPMHLPIDALAYHTPHHTHSDLGPALHTHMPPRTPAPVRAPTFP